LGRRGQRGPRSVGKLIRKIRGPSGAGSSTALLRSEPNAARESIESIQREPGIGSQLCPRSGWKRDWEFWTELHTGSEWRASAVCGRPGCEFDPSQLSKSGHEREREPDR